MMSKAKALGAIFLLTVLVAATMGQGMPKPKLAIVGVEDGTANGRQYRIYTIEIINRADFSDELFAASPDLQPCGKNSNSSRTWINIYVDGGRRYYGWCAIHSNTELSTLKFAVPADLIQPTKLYVDLVDRRQGKIIRSNKVAVTGN
jgi:hypothetical protein